MPELLCLSLNTCISSIVRLNKLDCGSIEQVCHVQEHFKYINSVIFSVLGFGHSTLTQFVLTYFYFICLFGFEKNQMINSNWKCSPDFSSSTKFVQRLTIYWKYLF